MGRYPNLTLALVLAVLIALGTWQGRRVAEIRKSESLFRWLVSAADQYGREGRLVPREAVDDPDAFVDETFFIEVAQKLEPMLPDVPPAGVADTSDLRLVRLVRAPEGDTHLDRQLWLATRSPAMASERDQYARYSQDRRLFTAVDQFGVGDLYAEDRVAANLGNIFFGFRQMAANLLWLQTDVYFHSGEDHRILPTVQTVVALDPHFIDAFLIGAWHMAYNMSAKLRDTPEAARSYVPRWDAWVGPKETLYYQGIDLLRDGINKNPRNYKLYFDLGFGIYAEKLRDYDNASLYLAEAIRYRHEPWVARTLYRVLEYAGKYEEAIEGWEHYLEAYDPGNPNAPRFIKYSEALIEEREGRALLDRARQTDPGPERQALLGQARERFDIARGLWRYVEDEFGVDPLARSRIRLMEALELREEGRYIEALAYLEQARSEASIEVFRRISDLIIEIKQEAGEPLNLTERMQVIRDEEAQRIREQRRAQTAGRTADQRPEGPLAVERQGGGRGATFFLAGLATLVIAGGAYFAMKKAGRR